MNKLFIQLFLGLLFPSMAICQRPEIILPKGHQAYIDDIVFSPDGSLLASAGDVPEGNVILWDVQSGREIKTLKTSDGGHLAFSPDGKLLAAAGHAGLVVWKLDDYTQIQIDDSEGAGWVYSVKFNHSGSLLAIGMEYVGYGKHYIRIYDVENHKLLKKLSGNITPCALAFSNNDSLLASGGGNGEFAAGGKFDFHELPARDAGAWPGVAGRAFHRPR